MTNNEETTEAAHDSSNPTAGGANASAATASSARRQKAEPAWRADLEQALEKEIEFSFVRTPLKDVVNFIGQVVQKNIVLDPKAVAKDERLVTLTVRRIPLKKALDLILGKDMGYIIKDRAIFISTKSRLRLLRR